MIKMMCFVCLIFFLELSLSAFVGSILRTPRCLRKGNTTYICHHFLPQDIPDGIRRVELLDIYQPRQRLTCDNSSFRNPNWKRVEYLKICDEYFRSEIYFAENCFTGLDSLIELQIHISSAFHLNENALFGLNGTQTLDLSRCMVLPFASLIQALDKVFILPDLRTFSMSSLGPDFHWIDGALIHSLRSRKIRNLDLSDIKMNYINLTSVVTELNFLKVLNLSRVVFEVVDYTGLRREDVHHIDSFDISFASLPLNTSFLFGKVNISDWSIVLKIPKFLTLLLQVETLNMTAFFPPESSLSISNVTVGFEKALHFRTEHLVFQRNNIKRLDLRLSDQTIIWYSLRSIVLSDNGLEYFNPTLGNHLQNVETLILSQNKLYMMGKENITLFEQLCFSMTKLKKLDLSSNKLSFIPRKMFLKNEELHVLELSSNELTQVTFELTYLRRLQLLDLANNKFSILDRDSLQRLDSLSNCTANGTFGEPPKVVLKSNPISCHNCESKEFIEWILNTDLVDPEEQRLMCKYEDGTQRHIDKDTLESVKYICKRRFVIAIATPSCIVLLIIIGGLIGFQCKKNRNKQKNKRIKETMKKIQNGLNEFEFMVMLSYSNCDEDFVMSKVFGPLNTNLQKLTRVDRDLVLTGDINFRPGFTVFNEIAVSLERSSVLLAFVTESYITSGFCRSELDMACFDRKPVILMFKENIDVEGMTPTMKSLYKRNTRIIWTVENGEYKLKTTWDNVGTSILDLIVADRFSH